MDESENLKEHKIQSKEIYNGHLLHVFSDEVRLPDGETSVREWIEHPGASAVLPVFKTGM
jgi:ADP-ribose pyrophosphatase